MRNSHCALAMLIAFCTLSASAVKGLPQSTTTISNTALHPSYSIEFLSGKPVEPAPQTTLMIPAGATLVLPDTAYAWDELVMNNGSVLAFTAPQVTITVQTLTLVGRSTIDLTPLDPAPAKPAPRPAAGQAGNNPAPQRGPNGTDGATGGDGKKGVNLTFSAQRLAAGSGSLWVRIDGGAGGPGGDGGGGGKGSSGPSTCTDNEDGGDGGQGGSGGTGGKGGNTGRVRFTLGPNSIAPSQAPGVAPSTRPTVPGIVISGAPGAGGQGGQGGPGGDGGEGHEGPGGRLCPSTDSRGGNRGPAGARGASGANGTFTP